MRIRASQVGLFVLATLWLYVVIRISSTISKAVPIVHISVNRANPLHIISHSSHSRSSRASLSLSEANTEEKNDFTAGLTTQNGVEHSEKLPFKTVKSNITNAVPISPAWKNLPKYQIPLAEHSGERPDCLRRFSTPWKDTVFDICKPDVPANTPASTSGTTTAASSSWTCMANTDVRSSVCLAHNILLDRKLITVTPGDEDIESVRNRSEDVEYCTYQRGAFGARCQPSESVDYGLLPHSMKAIHEGVQPDPNLAMDTRCEYWIDEPTLMVTRYEYVNLYHTWTDWVNAFQALLMADLIVEVEGKLRVREHITIIFLDGHAKGNLDSTWVDMFGNATVTFVSRLPTVTCFKKAIFVAPGYSGAFNFDGIVESCGKQPLYEKFREFVVSAYGMDDVKRDPHKVAIILREPYLAHPRVKMRIERAFGNIPAMLSALEEDIPNIRKGVAYYPNRLTFADQLRATRETSILIGAHGAGLTHVSFLPTGSHLLEIQGDYTARPHFRLMASLFGIPYSGWPSGQSVSHNMEREMVVNIENLKYFVKERL